MSKFSQQKVSHKDYLGKISSRRLKNLQHKLLEWYHQNYRKLPWRKTKNPYCIWVSEVMLQQTQTAKVLEYYQPFLKKFPTLDALASAPLDDVLKMWEGMGYYARARNLHKGARFVVRELQGRLPKSFDRLLTIPGVGPYTAAAVASIAFNLDYAVVDGNVERVLSRIFGIAIPPKTTAGKKIFTKIAEDFLYTGSSKYWNQTLMELGAVICAPQNPRCETCPAQKYCCAYRDLKNPSELPIKMPKTEKPHRHIVVGLIWKNGKLLIDQRKENGLLGGLWELPGGKVRPKETHQKALMREISEELDVKVNVRDFFMQVDHAYSHFSISMHVYHCDYKKGIPKALGCQKWHWADLNELDDFAFPKANRRFIDELLKQTNESLL